MNQERTDVNIINVIEQHDGRLPLGTVLHHGTYRIIKVLAQGGFGITYLAENIDNRQKVVIKEYYKKEWHKRDSTTSYVSKNVVTTNIEGKFRKKFEKEAHTIMRLNHPNIVKVFDFFEENGTLYYSMEFIDGCSLSDFVKKNGSVSENKCISFIRVIAKTLGYIHSQNELHLDITPRNIMMTKDGMIKLIDFGVSKHYTEDGEQSTTTPVAHSDGYAPKEQYLSEGIIKFSPATDVYALAATMYFMLTATTPPNANDRQQCLEEGRELLNIPMSLSENVRNAISWGMSISRKDRLQNTDEFLKTIDGTFIKEETDIDVEDKEMSLQEKNVLETLKKNKQYKEAYDFCVDMIQRGKSVSFAQEESEKLIPLLSETSKKSQKVIKIIIGFAVATTIISFLISIILSLSN